MLYNKNISKKLALSLIICFSLLCAFLLGKRDIEEQELKIKERVEYMKLSDSISKRTLTIHAENIASDSLRLLELKNSVQYFDQNSQHSKKLD